MFVYRVDIYRVTEKQREYIKGVGFKEREKGGFLKDREGDKEKRI